MKKDYPIIILAVAALIWAGVAIWIFLQKPETAPPEDIIPVGAEWKVSSYLELPSRSGKFLEFDEAKLEMTIFYFNTETMKVTAEIFKIDQETIFSKMPFEASQPNLFPRKGLREVKEETQITVFYLPAESGLPLARLVQVEALF